MVRPDVSQAGLPFEWEFPQQHELKFKKAKETVSDTNEACSSSDVNSWHTKRRQNDWLQSEQSWSLRLAPPTSWLRHVSLPTEADVDPTCMVTWVYLERRLFPIGHICDWKTEFAVLTFPVGCWWSLIIYQFTINDRISAFVLKLPIPKLFITLLRTLNCFPIKLIVAIVLYLRCVSILVASVHWDVFKTIKQRDRQTKTVALQRGCCDKGH